MALSKIMPTKYGPTVFAKYHRIVAAEVNYSSGTLRIALAGYADDASRQADAAPLGVGTVELRLADLGAEPTRDLVYGAIKTLPAWGGATDC